MRVELVVGPVRTLAALLTTPAQFAFATAVEADELLAARGLTVSNSARKRAMGSSRNSFLRFFLMTVPPENKTRLASIVLQVAEVLAATRAFVLQSPRRIKDIFTYSSITVEYFFHKLFIYMDKNFIKS